MRTWQTSVTGAVLVTAAAVSIAHHAAVRPVAGTPSLALPVCSASVHRMAEPFLSRDLASPFTDLCVLVTDGADLADVTDPL